MSSDADRQKIFVEPRAYDGFISYSHSADDLLAPRLQAGLQRFAKPWWKRRAVRIFRDESSLAANPHLWSSITEALDSSSWFVLLLSPDAAGSEWVGKEIEHWKANQPADRILPVVTDGEFGWSDGDVAGSSVPPALHGVFSEEPRWVDLRFARSDETLDLKNPAFAAAIADVASSIRGVPKDELASEEVRQHRSTVRTAWAAALSVTVLAVAAVGFGIQSGRNADVAQARELAASAIAWLDIDPELATLLALEALSTARDGQVTASIESALWRADQANRLVDVVDTGSDGSIVLDLSPDGTHLAISEELTAQVKWLNVESLEVEWAYADPNTVDSFTGIGISPDGSLVAVNVLDSTAPAAFREADKSDTKPNRIVVLNTRDGSVQTVVEVTDCATAENIAWSPDGRYLAFSSGLGGCPRGSSSQHWVEVLETETWARHAFIETPGMFAGAILRFDRSGRLFLTSPAHPTLIAEADSFAIVKVIEGAGGGDVTPDGSRIVVHNRPEQIGNSPVVFDADSGRIVDILTPVESGVRLPYGLRISNEGQHVLLATASAGAEVFDLVSGDLVFSLPGGASNMGLVDDEALRAYTAHDDGTIKIWDLGPRTTALKDPQSVGSGDLVFGDSFAISAETGAFVHLDQTESTYRVSFFDITSGIIGEASIEAYAVRALPKDQFLILDLNSEWVRFDPDRGILGTAITCQTPGIDCDENRRQRLPCRDCEETQEARYIDIVVSADGGEVFAHTPRAEYGGGSVVLLDGSYQPVGSVVVAEGFESLIAVSENFVMGEVSPRVEIRDRVSGETLYASIRGAAGIAPDESVAVVEVSGTGVVIVELPGGVTSDIEIEVGEVRGLAFSEDSGRVVVTGLSGLAVIDLASKTVVQHFAINGVADAFWMSDRSLLVGTIDGRWGELSLDLQDLVDRTRNGLRRSFTSSECDRFGISPCPTLEAARGD